jgi:hypothetical protein
MERITLVRVAGDRWRAVEAMCVAGNLEGFGVLRQAFREALAR